MRSRALVLLALLCALGCKSRTSNGTVDGGTNNTGPCVLSIDGMNTVTVDGWCVDRPTLISVDDQAVFVLDGVRGLLLRIDKSTGARTTLNGHPNDPKAWAPAADGGSEIFFSGCAAPNPCGFYAVPRTGGDVRKVVDLGPGVHGPVWGASVVADSNSIYWVDWNIWSAPRDGSGSARLLGQGPGSEGGGSVAVDSSALYVTMTPQNVVERIPLDGSPATTLSDRKSPGAIVASGSVLYWTEAGTLGIDCTPTDGSVQTWSGSGEPVTLVNQLAGVDAIAIIGSAVVWTNIGGFCNLPAAVGSVTELPTGLGSAPMPIAINQLEPGSLVSDGTNLFWTVTSSWDSGGAIVRAPLQ